MGWNPIANVVGGALAVLGGGRSRGSGLVHSGHGGDEGAILEYSRLPQRVSPRQAQQIEALADEEERNAEMLARYAKAAAAIAKARGKNYQTHAKHATDIAAIGAQVAKAQTDYEIGMAQHGAEYGRQKRRANSYLQSFDKAGGLFG